MLEPEFQRKKRISTKIYFLVAIIIFIIIIGVTFSYFLKQVNEELANNSNLNLLGEWESTAAKDWSKIAHSQSGYSLEIPDDWFKKEISRDMIISSYNTEESIQPTKRAKLEIQLVDNPLNQNPEEWWTGFYQASQSQDYTKETKNIVVDQITGVKKIIEDPQSNPLDLTSVVLVNYNKVMYVFNASTQGYVKEEYQEILDKIILSFKFPPITTVKDWTLPSLATTTITLIESDLINKNWQLYENIDLGFKIEYPDFWHIYSEGGVPEVGDYWQIIFEDKKFKGQSIERPFIAISVIKNQDNLNDWFELQKEALSATNLLYSESYNLNGQEGIMYTSGGLGLGYNFATFYNNNIYRIWSLTFFPADDTLMNYFKMLDSFRFLES